MSSSALSILIIGPSWVGDMVMAQSLFTLLVNAYSVKKLDVLAPPWSLPLLARMPEVNAAIEMPVGHGKLQLSTRYRLAKTLRTQHYDWAIVLPNSLKSALIPFFARIPKRTGFIGEMRWGWLNDVYTLNKSQLAKMVQRFVLLAGKDTIPVVSKIPIPRLNIDHTLAQQVLIKYAITMDKPLLALCPGAEFGIAKQWPAHHYAAFAQQKQQQGWQVCLLGSVKDKAICQQIEQQLQEQSLTDSQTRIAGDCYNLAGKTQLAEVIDILSLAQLVVSNDSGLMHIAAAVDVPVIGIYGSTDPDFTPPLSKKSRVVRLGLECSPCFQRQCPLGHTDCLEKLTPDDVEKAALICMDEEKTG